MSEENDEFNARRLKNIIFIKLKYIHNIWKIK